MLTHDLKSPISTLLGFARLLEDPRRGDSSEIAQGIQSSAVRALAIADNFLDYTQIESGSLELRREAVQLNGVVRDVADSQRSAATLRGISIETILAPDLPWLALDEALFGRALANLVGNAIKFSPERSRVSIETAERDGRVVVSVRDLGPGVAPADRGKLFQRFGLLAKRGKGSTGLGLFIVKTVVEAHGGEVELECPPQGGSIFRILLPAASAGS
jgi:signal transduction histidine kinase